MDRNGVQGFASRSIGNWLKLAVVFVCLAGFSATDAAAGNADAFLLKSNSDEVYCLLTMPEGWKLESLKPRHDADSSFLFSPYIGDYPSVAIDVFHRHKVKTKEEPEQQTTANELEGDGDDRKPGLLLSDQQATQGEQFYDNKRDLTWSRTLNDRLVTIDVSLTRGHRFQLSFMAKRSQRPTFEKTVIKILENADFQPTEEAIKETQKRDEIRAERSSEFERQQKESGVPEFILTTPDDDAWGWWIWIVVFVTVGILVAGLLLIERLLRDRQQAAFEEQVTVEMESRRSGRRYDQAKHFKSSTDNTSPE